MLAIEAEGLEKCYPGRLGRAGTWALRGLDLAVPAGAAFGLIGPNGAGKTTFVKALLGVVHPTGGRIRLLGGDPQDPRVRARVGYLPERLELLRAWTPLEVLASVARFKRLGLDRAHLLGRLEEVGLAGEATRAVGGFSKGMRQRVGLATALLGEPELLVLDEPTDPGQAVQRLFAPKDQALGARLAAAASRIELHVDAMQDVAAVVRVHGEDPAALSDLARTLGGAIAAGRLEAQASGDAKLAELLDGARVSPEDGRFSLELALPAATLERWFEGCAGRPPGEKDR